MIRAPIAQAVRCKTCYTSTLFLSHSFDMIRFRMLCPTRIRVYTTTPRHRKKDPRIQSLPNLAAKKIEDADSTQPESIAKDKPAEAELKDPLLAEQTVSNKEQRKADWAIIKEMSKYLWPKVGLHPILKTVSRRLTNL